MTHRGTPNRKNYAGINITMRAFTLVELLVVLLLIMILVGISLTNFVSVREQTDDIQLGSQIHQAKLDILSQQMTEPTGMQFTYTDEKGFLWVYNRRDKLIIGTSPSGEEIYTGNIYED